MADPDQAATSVVADIAQNLGGVFRHMLPGVLVVAATYVAHPSWLASVAFTSWEHLVALAVLTIAVGNTWFAFNRYGFHQLLDYLLYRCGIEGPAQHGKTSTYTDDLGKYTYKSLHTPDTAFRARQHVAFRASTVLLILTVGELAIVFSLWHGQDSVLVQHTGKLFLAGCVAIAVAVWQLVITRRIDYYVVNPPHQH